MPSRRQIREVVVQFLYCADMEGGPEPAGLREPFWEFVTESDRRNLQVATYRAVHHFALGRESRLEEFIKREQAAETTLAGYPEAESLSRLLKDMAKRESIWSSELAALARLPKDDDNDDGVASRFERALQGFFRVDRDLSDTRARFLNEMEDFPTLQGRLEAVSASVRRLQRISDRLRMVETPENFPEQIDLNKIRDSKAELRELRTSADALADQVLARKEQVDSLLAEAVENYVPERIGLVDRSILRLAVYELTTGQVPVKVVINEAVEIAKRFGTSDSGRFVNGVLDKVATQMA